MLIIINLSDKNVFKIIEMLNNNLIEDIDISNLVFCKPFYALVLATELAYYQEKTGQKIALKGYSYFIDAHTYLGHIVFLEPLSIQWVKSLDRQEVVALHPLH